MKTSDSRRQQAERRNMLAGILVAALIGVAYAEMVGPVRASVRSSGITLSTVMLFSVFFLTTVRFFTGNQLHLMSEAFLEVPGWIWFYDLVFIMLETVATIFLAGVSTIEESRKPPIGFFGLLIILYGIDVLWILSQWVFGQIRHRWRRGFIPWAWGILNTALIVGMIVIRLLVGDFHSDTAVLWLGILNGIGFIVDVILVHYYMM